MNNYQPGFYSSNKITVNRSWIDDTVSVCFINKMHRQK